MCFVLEVDRAGRARHQAPARHRGTKYVNVAVLEGNQLKVLDERGGKPARLPSVLTALLGFDASSGEAVNVLIELAVSMRAHGRGGALLDRAVGQPQAWLSNRPTDFVRHFHALLRAVTLALGDTGGGGQLAILMVVPKIFKRRPRGGPEWQDTLHRVVDVVAGLTAVDGATVLSDRTEVLAFGARSPGGPGSPPRRAVVVTEPIEGTYRAACTRLSSGGPGTSPPRSSCQDQRDAVVRRVAGRTVHDLRVVRRRRTRPRPACRVAVALTETQVE